MEKTKFIRTTIVFSTETIKNDAKEIADKLYRGNLSFYIEQLVLADLAKRKNDLN